MKQTDPNLLVSKLEYDALGRLSKVWMPDRTGTAGLDPSVRYTYLVRTDKPVAIKTGKRQNDGSYSVEYKLHDGLLRPRQVQTEGPGGTRMVADTFYTGTGKLAKTYATYNVTGAPRDTIYPAVNGEVNGQTLYVYDGADRVKAEIFAVAGNEKWRTTTYGGDRISVDPPQGGAPMTTVMNALGQTTHLLQYQGADPTGPADTTTYTYTKAGQLATVTDPANNVWRHEYDQLGRRVKSIDPDAGTSTIEYDDLDRVTSTVNGVGARISTTYDDIGRTTAVYKGTVATGELLSSWMYDLELLGTLFSASRWVGDAEYATYPAVYDEFYRPHATYYSVPEHAGAELAGFYTFGTEYNRDGSIQSVSMSDGGGLPFETIVYTYDGLERLTAITGDDPYLTDIDYAATGEVLQTEALVGTRKVWSTYEYEQGSKRLTRQRLDREAAPVVDIDAYYTYDPSGNILRIANNPSGTRDTQCFTYDYLRRMERAWTSASTATDPCAGVPSVTGVGGVAPYHHFYTFDLTGNRETETIRRRGNPDRRAHGIAGGGYLGATLVCVDRGRPGHSLPPRPPAWTPRLPRTPPPQILTAAERTRVLALFNSPTYADLAIPQVWARELDEGRYWCSVSTMYRIARAAGQSTERRRLATHPPRVRPELVAHGLNQVWSWDITALKGPTKGVWCRCYVIIDIFSRYVTGWLVAAAEDAVVAKDFLAAAIARSRVEPHTIHADRGGAMVSRPVSELLVDLGVMRSHSRPRTSNDNPYSEAQFKTMKYVPDFPTRFGSLEDARAFWDGFFTAYNHEHRHSGIGMHTPASTHYGTADQIRDQRQATLDQAWTSHPHRLTRRPRAPRLPEIAWINQPVEQPCGELRRAGRRLDRSACPSHPGVAGTAYPDWARSNCGGGSASSSAARVAQDRSPPDRLPAGCSARAQRVRTARHDGCRLSRACLAVKYLVISIALRSKWMIFNSEQVDHQAAREASMTVARSLAERRPPRHRPAIRSSLRPATLARARLTPRHFFQ